jgi:hypothetical protein
MPPSTGINLMSDIVILFVCTVSLGTQAVVFLMLHKYIKGECLQL